MVSLIRALNNIVANNISPIAAHKFHSHVRSKVLQKLNEAADLEAQQEAANQKREARAAARKANEEEDEDTIDFGDLFASPDETCPDVQLNVNTGVPMDVEAVSPQASPAEVTPLDSSVAGPREELLLSTFTPSLKPSMAYSWNNWKICCLNGRLHLFSNYAYIQCPVEFSLPNSDAKLPPLLFECLFATKSDGPFALEITRDGKNHEKTSQYVAPLLGKNLLVELCDSGQEPASVSNPKFVIALSCNVTDGFYRVEYTSETAISTTPFSQSNRSKWKSTAEGVYNRSQLHLDGIMERKHADRGVPIDLTRNQTAEGPIKRSAWLNEINFLCEKEPQVTEPSSEEPISRITCSAGNLTRTLDECYKSQDDASKNKDAQRKLLLQKLETVRLRIYQLSQYLLDMELKLPKLEHARTSPTPTASPSPGEPKQRQLIRLNSALQIRSHLELLRHIKDNIEEAAVRRLVFQSAHASSSALDQLGSAFSQLAQVFKQGEHTAMSYELALSGLINSLWFALSASFASHWHIESCDR
ncbi:hypothetical protein Ciccas_008510, partial [Cichlidogyrus casuarinus]